VSPLTHLLASWIVAAKTTDNPRDCRLVTLAGVLPDLDGAGLLVDLARSWATGIDDFSLYQQYHHTLLHGVFGAAVIAGLAAAFARRRLRVAVVALALVHLHLLCDLLGSRGPDPGDLWTIPYLAPFSFRWTWIWQNQWRLDGWQNQVITLVLLAWMMRLAIQRGDSVVGVISRRADAAFVRVLRGWAERWKQAQARRSRATEPPS
jgi:membrane-bound metal-dependent hydrolase YbcI (DUF457 family)